jgi:CHAT domain-containing protein
LLVVVYCTTLATVTVPAGAAPPGYNVQQRFEMVEQAYAARKYAATLQFARTGATEAMNGQDSSQAAIFFVYAALAQAGLGHYIFAVDEYQRALGLYRKYRDPSAAEKVLGDIGNAYANLGRYSKALSYDRAARHASEALGYRRGEAINLFSIGEIDVDLGRYGDALDSLMDAQATDHADADVCGEANDILGIGNAYAMLGRYDSALEYYARGLGLGCKPADDAELRPSALGDIGATYSLLGRYGDFLASEQGVYATFRSLHDVDGEARALGDIGIAYEDLGHSKQALAAQQRALAFDRAHEELPLEASALVAIGIIYSDLGEYGSALDSFERAEAIHRRAGQRDHRARDLLNICNADRNLGRLSSALTMCRQALASMEAFHDAEVWSALLSTALVEAKLDRTSDALAHFGAAIDRIEALRAGLSDQSNRRAFSESTAGVYDAYLAYLLELDRRFPGRYDSLALDVFEREQARSFLEEVGTSSARRVSGVPPKLVEEERQLEDEIAANHDAFAKAEEAQPIDIPGIEEIANDGNALVRRQNALEAMLREKYPAYSALTHPRPLDASGLERLLAPGELMLVYAVLDKETALWVVDSRAVRMYALPIGTAEVAKRVAVFRSDSQAMQIAVDQNTKAIGLTRIAADGLPGFARASYALYAALLPPSVQTTVAAAKLLFIVPTGALYSVPWEALVTRAPAGDAMPRYLLEDHAVSYLASASLLGVLRDTEAHRGTAPRDPLLAFADPNYAKIAPSGGSTAPTDGSVALKTGPELRAESLTAFVSRGRPGENAFPNLSGSATEVEAVSALFSPPPESHPLYEQDDASRANVLRLSAADCTKGPCLKDYRYVIFATHAVLPDEVSGVLQPALVMAHPYDDGFLTMGDVLGLSLDADVVSLSACNTGGGTPTHGQGVRGLTQAFMYAGTPVVSVTLWDIADAAAEQITPAFYAGIKAGESPAEALRSAKLQMLHGDNPLFQDPYFWAPTVLFGDGANVER